MGSEYGELAGVHRRMAALIRATNAQDTLSSRLHDDTADAIEALAGRARKLEAALAFYANGDNYTAPKPGRVSAVEHDMGRKARIALSQKEKT